MGLDYSLCAIFERSRSASILRDLAPFIEEPERSIFASIDWSPATEVVRRMRIGIDAIDAHGVANAPEGWIDKTDEIGVALDVELEPEHRTAFVQGDPVPSDSTRPFGPFWISIQAGSKYVLLTARVPTTVMSTILVSSESVQSQWATYASQSRAICAYVDIEQDVALLIYPDHGGLRQLKDLKELFPYERGLNVDRQYRLLALPDEITLGFVDGIGENIDYNAGLISIDHFVGFISSFNEL